ncbi:MAG: CpaF family protein, partial [Actinomyces sp.]
RSPCVDARLADGSRIHVVVPPIALDGPYVTIRRFTLRRVALDAFTTPAVAGLVERAVAAAMNVLVSGGTGAGKTTLLNAISSLAPATERFVTIEDSAELALPHPHVVRLEGRPASSEGVGEVDVRELVRNALRMRPDRIVVGEIRDASALDLVQALNTGHAGCLSTVHANGPLDALRRVETLALMAAEGVPLAALRAQVTAAVDVVVHVVRDADGRRRIGEVAEVVGPDEVTVLARDGQVVGRPVRPARRGGGATW